MTEPLLVEHSWTVLPLAFHTQHPRCSCNGSIVGAWELEIELHPCKPGGEVTIATFARRRASPAALDPPDEFLGRERLAFGIQ